MSNEEDKVEVFDEEKNLRSDHNYDGIHKSNHPLPIWWVAIFIITVVFSIPYYFNYQNSSGSNLKEKLVAALEEKQGGFNLDEYNTYIKSDAKKIAKSGMKIYKRKCRVCHGAQGEGGVGPNLTDMFWINGNGSVASVYEVVDKGVTDKGMAAWGEALGKEKLMAVVEYVMKFKGTNPKNAKAPQGTEFK